MSDNGKSRQRRNRILEEWNGFKRMVYTQGMTTEQEKQLKMAFFGGASAAKHVMMRDLAPGEEPTEADLDILRDMQDELNAYAEAVKAGRT